MYGELGCTLFLLSFSVFARIKQRKRTADEPIKKMTVKGAVATVVASICFVFQNMY